MEGTGAKEFQSGGLKVGEMNKMVGTSLAWWGEDGKIRKGADYVKVVETFEGR